MNLSSPIPFPNRLRALWAASPWTLPLTVAAVLALALAGWQGWQRYQAARWPGTPATPAMVEAAWGIQITRIAVTADGGLIDFRFVIIDPDKAGPLLNLDNRPRLIAEDSGALVDSLMHPPHGHELVPGQVHFLLYNNTNSAIQRGAPVSVVIGDLRLEHLIAR